MGFTTGKSTLVQIHMSLNNKITESQEPDKNIQLFFKAIYNVANKEKLWNVTCQLGISEKITRLICACLQRDQSAK